MGMTRVYLIIILVSLLIAIPCIIYPRPTIWSLVHKISWPLLQLFCSRTRNSITLYSRLSSNLIRKKMSKLIRNMFSFMAKPLNTSILKSSIVSTLTLLKNISMNYRVCKVIYKILCRKHYKVHPLSNRTINVRYLCWNWSNLEVQFPRWNVFSNALKK